MTLSESTRALSVGSRTALQHGSIVPNSQSEVKLVDQKSESGQKERQERSSLKARLTGCVPDNPNGFVFFLFVVIYLICGVIHFAQTNDGGMLTTLLPYAGAYVGIPMVTSQLPLGRKEKHKQ